MAGKRHSSWESEGYVGEGLNEGGGGRRRPGQRASVGRGAGVGVHGNGEEVRLAPAEARAMMSRVCLPEVGSCLGPVRVLEKQTSGRPEKG